MTRAAERVGAEVGRHDDVHWFRAPGRVNLIGDHTDYNDGFVLPMAVDRDCVVAARGARRVRVTSLDVGETIELAPDGTTPVESMGSAWGRLVAAVVAELAARGRPPVGMEAMLASDVPLGSGLSSSAALEVACGVALAGIADWSWEPVELALACRAAEERATGVPCGIMDQLISAAGRADSALLIDCRSLEIREVRLPPGLGVLAVYSGQERSLASSAYAERRRRCEALARALGVPALRDATPSEVENDPIGRHVVSENERVLESVRALKEQDLSRLGELMTASHASLRDDFRVSTPELDTLVGVLIEAGALGARLTGAGFGGSVVAVCDVDDIAGLVEATRTRYLTLTGLVAQPFVCHAADGTGRLDVRAG
ncbi:MAG TPA: galactokinase [Gaiellaceae bacterium]|nr:galactokinase [Gaiellaceae bacterium]